MRVQNGKALIGSLVLGTAIAISIARSAGVRAADLPYPPPAAAPPPYGDIVPPPVVPPRALLVPAPSAAPPYYGAPVAPSVFGPSYGIVPPAGVAVVPRGPCPQIAPCVACDSHAGCTPYAERYPSLYEPLGPRVYPNVQSPSPSEPNSGAYSPGVYSGPIGPYPFEGGRYRP
jgi:hypothetical protein